MRKTIISLFAGTILLASCSEKIKSTTLANVGKKVDSVVTTISFPVGTGYVITKAERVIKDTLIKVTADSAGVRVVIKEVPGRDTTYYIPSVDTLKQNGKIVLDSLKRPVPIVHWYSAKPSQLFDYNKAF